ncbi:glycoside hydrolase family 99-like domain-containing protein [Anaerovibrio sp. RM50]|uniref:glycosyltransferase WbsX family protein n=1 Tax=Anaerovibrio sp. RM50 TaxID=1200557 RepID=UPI00048065DB|nr:glycoside hydrolase family 99-like domain-containing protein [Anaerovibrio sp. RM50]
MEYLHDEEEHFDAIFSRLGNEFALAAKKIAIYGTGNGAKSVYNYLVKKGVSDNVVIFLDQDSSPMIGLEFCSQRVGILEDYKDIINVILVAAKWNHKAIVNRLNNIMLSTDILIIDMYEKVFDKKDLEEYISYIDELQYSEKKEYVEIADVGYQRMHEDTKVIAWYLPQYHVTEYNNRFHGVGFTEWTNSSKTMPQFCGHYQPHIPSHMGYYDLSNYRTIKRQAELARFYGIYGFAIHYYWFNERTKMLDTPIKLLRENKDIDINYFINWATEDWGMTWDDGFSGKNYSDSFIKQELPQDIDAFLDELIPYFQDERYIKVNGMPVLSVYNCNVFKKTEFRDFTDKLRKKALVKGVQGIYIIITTGSNDFDDDVHDWGGDALVEYQPNYMCQSNLLKSLYPKGYINPHFKGTIRDTRDYFEEKKYFSKHISKKYYRCACTNWDNTARKGKIGARIIWGITPEKLRDWLVDLITESKTIHDVEDDFVFISSWNEWAEGSHLEPDMRYGYAWLNAVRSALEKVKERL